MLPTKPLDASKVLSQFNGYKRSITLDPNSGDETTEEIYLEEFTLDGKQANYLPGQPVALIIWFASLRLIHYTIAQGVDSILETATHEQTLSIIVNIIDKVELPTALQYTLSELTNYKLHDYATALMCEFASKTRAEIKATYAELHRLQKKVDPTKTNLPLNNFIEGMSVQYGWFLEKDAPEAKGLAFDIYHLVSQTFGFDQQRLEKILATVQHPEFDWQAEYAGRTALGWIALEYGTRRSKLTNYIFAHKDLTKLDAAESKVFLEGIAWDKLPFDNVNVKRNCLRVVSEFASALQPQVVEQITAQLAQQSALEKSTHPVGSVAGLVIATQTRAGLVTADTRATPEDSSGAKLANVPALG